MRWVLRFTEFIIGPQRRHAPPSLTFILPTPNCKIIDSTRYQYLKSAQFYIEEQCSDIAPQFVDIYFPDCRTSAHLFFSEFLHL